MILDPMVDAKVDSLESIKLLADGFSRSCHPNFNTIPLDIMDIIYKQMTPKGMNDGIHRLVYRSIMKCDSDIRSKLFRNILFCGGNTMFRKLDERIKNELTLLVDVSTKIKVMAPLERKYSIWIGGSIVTSRSTFQDKWITMEEYNEYGPQIVHRKCDITLPF
eukprot:UN13121